MTKLNLKVIDCENYIYIANDDRWNSSLSRYLFDGKSPKPTNRSDYFKIDKIPSEISVKKPNRRENERYELKTGYAATEMMPQIITKEMYNSDEYEDVIGLYTYKYDEVDDGYENVEFTIKVVHSRKDFEFVVHKKYPSNVDLLTEIEYPEEAYQDMPNSISGEKLLPIIREYVRKNIDTSVASIKSDYDFHFEVVKKITLDKPYLYQTNLNSGNKRRKPNWVTRMVTTKEESIINFKDKPSSTDYGKSCKVCPSIIGENYKDLCDKIDRYLEELITTINKKYCECPKCSGWGIVEVEDEG